MTDLKRIKAKKLARLNVEGLMAEINSERFRRKQTWKKVAKETGVNPSTLSRLVTQETNPDVDALCSLIYWLNRPLTDFMIVSADGLD